MSSPTPESEITEARIAIAVAYHATPEGCRQALGAFMQTQGANGWLCGTDRVHAVSSGADLAAVGAVLSGALVSADGLRSVQVQYLNPEQGWQVTTVEEGQGGPQQVYAVRDTVLAIHPDLKGEANAGRKAVFVTYWPRTVPLETRKGEPCPQPGPLCVRFLGFKGGE